MDEIKKNLNEVIISTKNDVNGRFILFLIFNYVHSRLYNILIPFTKLCAIALAIFMQPLTPSRWILIIFGFFYFEFYSIYMYFSIRKKFLNQYHTTSYLETLHLEENQILVEMDFGNVSVMWSNVDEVIETRFLFIVKKNTRAIFAMLKVREDPENVAIFKNYMLNQQKLYPNIRFSLKDK